MSRSVSIVISILCFGGSIYHDGKLNLWCIRGLGNERCIYLEFLVALYIATERSTPHTALTEYGQLGGCVQN
jgi:hypothetical protein